MTYEEHLRAVAERRGWTATLETASNARLDSERSARHPEFSVFRLNDGRTMVRHRLDGSAAERFSQ